jgi:biopolymer transport protein ExbB
MNDLWTLWSKGGPVMTAIVALSVLLYARCFNLLLSLRRLRRQSAGNCPLAEARRRERQVREAFGQERYVLVAMIAAAPLLGLLGTVNGMATTFANLSLNHGEKSMEGLASGISEVLVATESGLAVALPAMLLVYLAHREMQEYINDLNCRQTRAGQAIAAP